jgi:hypothetical protein
MNIEERIVQHLIDTTSLLRDIGADDFIVIGGVALRCHMNTRQLEPLINTSDADVMCGYNSFSILRTKHEVSNNMRLNKHEYKVSYIDDGKDTDFDVDLYVDQLHSLNINFSSLDETKTTNQDGTINTASIANLLRLKIDNYMNFTGNKECQKHNKIIHDIIQLVGLLHVTSVDRQQIFNAIDDARFEALKTLILEHGPIVESVNHRLGISCINECIERCSNIIGSQEG